MSTVVLALLLALAPAPADRAWQDGVLMDVTNHTAGTKTSGKKTNDMFVFEYTIQTADKFYVADTSAAVKPTNPINLDVNGKVTFAIEKQNLYLKDKAGKEFKLGIVKQGLRQAGAPKPGQ